MNSKKVTPEFYGLIRLALQFSLTWDCHPFLSLFFPFLAFRIGMSILSLPQLCTLEVHNLILHFGSTLSIWLLRFIPEEEFIWLVWTWLRWCFNFGLKSWCWRGLSLGGPIKMPYPWCGCEKELDMTLLGNILDKCPVGNISSYILLWLFHNFFHVLYLILHFFSTFLNDWNAPTSFPFLHSVLFP